MTQDNVADIVGKLKNSERTFIGSLADFGGETFDEDEGDLKAAQHLERAGLGYVSAWREGWSFTLNEEGLAVRQHLLSSKGDGR